MERDVDAVATVVIGPQLPLEPLQHSHGLTPAPKARRLDREPLHARWVDRAGERGNTTRSAGGDPNALALSRPGEFDLVDLFIARTSSLSLGIAALVLWAVSWSWLIGISTTVVRIGEVGALVVGLAAVAVGLTIRPRPAGLRLSMIALALVLGLNLLGLVLY
jgi:hypothetical protein